MLVAEVLCTHAVGERAEKTPLPQTFALRCVPIHSCEPACSPQLASRGKGAGRVV